MANILLIQQDSATYKAIESAMSYDAHTLQISHSLDADDLYPHRPDLIILYLSESISDDACSCEQVRAVPRFEKTPILVVSKTKSAQCAAQALDAGCDDYMTEPLIDRLLAARVRALLRRRPHSEHRDVLTLDSKRKVAQLGERTLGLTNVEYELLEALCTQAGKYLSASTLLQQVWHYPPGHGNEALVRNHVRNLRRKLETDPDHPRIVLSSHGRGYMVNGEVHRY
jgi:two-component system response regulator RpaA